MATPTLGGGGLSSADVLSYAQRIASMSDSGLGINMCQRFVREAFGSSGGAATAVEAWRNTPIKHTRGTPPAGTAVYWSGGAGHAAISAGNGYVYSTDWQSPGRVSLARIDDITQKWGKTLLGWTTQTNERKITTMNAKPVEGIGGTGGKLSDPVYTGNATVAGGGDATGFSKKELRERYGYAADTYAGIPEIQKLVKLGIKGQWTADEFQHRVMASKWYKNHTEEERQWALKSTGQPGEAAQEVEQKKQELMNQYRQLGVAVAPKRLDEIARASVVHGWTPQQDRNALVGEFDYNPSKTLGGQAGQTVDQFRKLASDYVVPLSNKTMDQWTTNVLRGEATPDDFVSYLKAQAKTQWDDPQMQAALDRGVTTSQYLSPLAESAAKLLEVNPEDIDWSDPKWAQGAFHTDPKTGARSVMGLAQWQNTLRTDPKYGFDKTSGARDQGAQFASELASMFGAR